MLKPSIYILSIITIIFLSSCKKDGGNNRWLNVELTASSNIQTTQISQSKFSVSIYGYDPNYQDVPASLIILKEFKTSNLPYSFKMDIPKDAYKKIKYLNDKKYAKYYLTIDWDSNGTGQRCDGDLFIDYVKEFPSIELDTDNKHLIFLTLCQ
jgi:hypothetical protein